MFGIGVPVPDGASQPGVLRVTESETVTSAPINGLTVIDSGRIPLACLNASICASLAGSDGIEIPVRNS